MKYKFTLYHFLAVLMVIAAIGAIPAGVTFIQDPSGHRSGATINVLDSTPFIDFYFPGLFILVFIVLGNFAAAVVTFLKIEVCCFLGIASGIILIIWNLVQFHWCGFNFFQPIFILLALTEAVTGYIIFRRILRGINPREHTA